VVSGLPAPADRAGALGRAGTVLSHDTSKELRPDEIPLIRNARLLQLTAAGVDWAPTCDLPRELLIAANKGEIGGRTATGLRRPDPRWRLYRVRSRLAAGAKEIRTLRPTLNARVPRGATWVPHTALGFGVAPS
jgi:hypothetical protein